MGRLVGVPTPSNLPLCLFLIALSHEVSPHPTPINNPTHEHEHKQCYCCCWSGCEGRKQQPNQATERASSNSNNPVELMGSTRTRHMAREVVRGAQLLVFRPYINSRRPVSINSCLPSLTFGGPVEQAIIARNKFIDGREP